MRRIDICEERGSGIDKVIESVEGLLLPPPDFISYESSTKAILFARKDFSEMNWDERVRACNQHACLCSVSNQVITNLKFILKRILALGLTKVGLKLLLIDLIIIFEWGL